jgi:hypothetical protein
MSPVRRSPRDPHAHAIHRPGQRLLRGLPLRAVLKTLDRGRRPILASPNLVSLIDVLVVTVVFLLASFSASGE